MITAAEMTTAEVAERIGCSYRQIDYWTHVGYLQPVGANAGSGQPRSWPEREIRIASLILTLERAGFRLEVAARLARAHVVDDEGFFYLGPDDNESALVVEIDWVGVDA